MSKKQFDKFFVANLKRTAQMVSPLVRRKQKLQQEIAAAQEEILGLDNQISSLDGHIRTTTGYGIEDLVKRVVVNTGKNDKDGNPIKITKWELVYPETVVPGEVENTCLNNTIENNDTVITDPEFDKELENNFLN